MADAQLAIKVTSDATDAVRGLDDVGSAATDMANKVDTASNKMGVVADASDNMASSSAQAAGGLGDLGGALALMPGPLGAVGGSMEALSPAIMGVTGASDLLNLATSSSIVTQGKAKVAAIGHTIATKAQSAATKAAAAGQWLLNTAMAANPIGLIIIAVIALVAGFVLLYKKSETFRELVQKVGDIGARAIGWVVDKVSDLIDWFADAAGWLKDKLPAAWRTMKDVAVRLLDLITSPFRTLFGIIQDVYSWVKEKVPAAFETVKNKAQAIAGALLSPFQRLKDFINDLIEKAQELIRLAREAAGIGSDKTGVVGGTHQIPSSPRIAPSSTFERPAPTTETINIRVDGSIIGTTDERVGDELLKAINRARRVQALPAIG